jgi:hypothetical protein
LLGESWNISENTVLQFKVRVRKKRIVPWHVCQIPKRLCSSRKRFVSGSSISPFAYRERI